MTALPHLPPDLRYTTDHEWVREGDPATVGITAVAAEALGDVVFVELPEVGAVLRAGDACGEVESTKAVSDLYAPTDGEVVEVNLAVDEEPGLLNRDPYGEGWLFRLHPTGSATGLLDASAYAAVVGDAG